MWKIQRYYLREVTTNSLITMTVLFGIVLFSLVYKGIRYAGNAGLLAAAEITFYWAADALPHLMPIALLFAIVLAFARASQDREITALRAAGISPRVAVAPALMLGIFFSILSAVALHYLVPAAHFRKYRVIADHISTAFQSMGMNTGDRLVYKGLVVTWDHINENGEWVDVVARIKRGDEFIIVEADRAWTRLLDEERFSLVLEGVQTPGARDQVRLKETTEISVNLREISEKERRNEGDRDLTSDQLLAEVYRDVHRNPNGARYTVHKRSCFALLPALLAPIGFCIGVFSQARGRVLALVFALVPIFIFYMGDMAGKKLVRAFDWPLFGWMPVVMLALFGVPFCWKLLRR